MADINLKEYLKNVAELESSIYNQKEILKKSKKTFSERQPHKKQIKRQTVEMPVKPPELDSEAGAKQYSTEKDKKKETVGMLGCGGTILCLIAGFLGGLFGEELGFGLLLGLGIAAPFIIMFIASIVMPQDKSGSQQKYDEEMKTYESAKHLAEEQNRALLAQWQAGTEQENKRFAEASSAFAKNKENTLAPLEANLNKTQEILNAYYDKDIIFGKYRNLVAMTTMYEYFASGRCSELEGPNGAYNLFEQESRQNIIITNLQDINMHLGDIKNNQYVLYQAMNQGLQTMNKISSDISGMASCVKTIEQASQVTAYCAEVTAMNGIYQNSIMTF